MNDFFEDKYDKDLENRIAILIKKLNIAIVGLEAIISEGSDNLNIAEKTIKAIEDCDEELPQSQ